MILEAYRYNFTCLQNIPMLIPLIYLFEFLDQIVVFLLSLPLFFTTSTQPCMAGGMQRRTSLVCAGFAAPCSPTHHCGSADTVALRLDGALQLVPAARSIEPRTFQQWTLSSSKPPTRPAASATSPRKKQPHPWLCWSRGRSASCSGTAGAPMGTSWCAFGFVNHSPMATSWKTSVSRSYSLATAAGSWNEWSKES